MSVINQMLNGLEQRGIHLDAEQVRPVHKRAGRMALFVLLVVALVCLLLVKYLLPVVLPVARVTAHPLQLQPVVKAAVISAPQQPLLVVSVPGVAAVVQDAAPPKTSRHEHDAIQLLAAKALMLPVVHPLKLAPMSAPDAFHQAQDLLQQGKKQQAGEWFVKVLQQNPENQAARSALVALMLGDKQTTEAEQLLQDGLKLKPADTGFAMLLARLQVQRGDVDTSITTLEGGLPQASAEYQAFYAALLQRKGRYGESAEYYQRALTSTPGSGIWQMGYGISLQALSKSEEARQAYQRALDSQTLSAELQVFVLQKLKEL